MNIVKKAMFNLSDEIENNRKLTEIRITIKVSLGPIQLNRFHTTMSPPEAPRQMPNAREKLKHAVSSARTTRYTLAMCIVGFLTM